LRSGADTSLLVLHKCDRRKCVNPEHLFLGTHADNVRDKVTKGRQARVRGKNHGFQIHPGTAARGERSGRAKLTQTQVDSMRRMFQAGTSCGVIAEQFGITVGHVYHLRSGKKWKDG
jgi:hypothetical protein